MVSGNFGERPEPPVILTKRQQDIWKAVVASEDPVFFNTEVLRGMLADYCKRRAIADEISEVIDGLGDTWSGDRGGALELERLLRMRDREQKAVANFATKLRLTNQARYQSAVAARVVERGEKADEPWRKSA